MPEIKTNDMERLQKFMKENNLEVNNHTQVCAKLMELEEEIVRLKDRWQKEATATEEYNNMWFED